MLTRTLKSLFKVLMSSKYIQLKILVFFVLVKSERLRQISRENKDFFKKTTELTSQILFIDYNIIKTIFFIEDLCSNSGTKITKTFIRLLFVTSSFTQSKMRKNRIQRKIIKNKPMKSIPQVEINFKIILQLAP